MGSRRPGATTTCRQNVNTAASSSSSAAGATGSLHHQGSTRRLGHRGGRSASEPSRIHHQGPPLQGRRGRGTSCNHQVLLDPPNKQATGSTRFSYVWVVEFGDQVALVSVRIERLSQRIIPSSLVRLSTSELLTPCELHEVLEVKVRNKKSAHLVKVCVAKVNLRALTGGAGGTGEAAQEVQRLHDWSGGGSHRGKQPQTHR